MTEELYRKANKLKFISGKLETLLEKLSDEDQTIRDQEDIGIILTNLYKSDSNIRDGINNLLTDLLNNIKSEFKSL